VITVQPARQRPADRRQTPSDKPTTHRVVTLPAPVKGWVTNISPAAMPADSAWVIDNFWPNTTGIKPRGGYKNRVDIDAAATTLFEYAAGDEYIVTDASKIYTFTDATSDGTTLTAAVSSLTSGDWHGVETQNDGGSFFTMVNGSDNLQLYDGTTWYTVTDVSATHSITGSGLSGTDAFTYVANYRERQVFVEGGTMNAWYLGVNSVSGTATKFPIAGIFNKGGSLHSITTFSSDAGDGLDDRIVFLTTNGEFALYSGDLASPSLVGVYEIGAPISRAPFLRVSGDVMVVTEAGLIPVSAAVQKDPSQLKAASVSAPIDREWEYWQQVQGSGWVVDKWPSRNMALIAVPAPEPFLFVLNLETGAWARFTGWDVTALRILGDRLHFTTGVDINLGETGGQDNGNSFVCQACMAFQSFGTPGVKTAKLVRGNFISSVNFRPKFSIAVDYTADFPTAPNAELVASTSNSAWDAVAWDVAEWGSYGERRSTVSDWYVVSGYGFALAVQLQITSGASAKLDCDLVSYDLGMIAGDT